MSHLFQLIATGSNASLGEQSACNRRERLKIERGPILHLPLARRIAALVPLPTLKHCNT
ncbi:hypothetical protein J2W23_004525 [Variovorax boronicumulans]|uniref:hypothetical protein n=1 Tax=Variovorax boronicumulans TaxID=436515 RepID=UPI00278923A7|nr:hypothetical protein [Variovorax boronicumulans]MDQ0016124.1 hypothetical protein [Variovorax boronicumulans]